MSNKVIKLHSITKAAKAFSILILCNLLLIGCLSQKPVENIAPAPKGVAPQAAETPELPAYRFQVGDIMDIKLLLNPEFNDQVMVRPDGMISTALATDIKAYGRTPAEVQKELEEIYAKQLVNPRLSVIVRSVAPTRVYVIGEVNNPGEFISVGPTLTMLQAIARAGGVKNSARADQIVVVRRGAADKPEVYQASYNAAVTGSDPAADIRLAAYDVVYVPRSDVGDAYLHFQQYVQQFLPPSFNLGYQLGSSNN